jgi:peptidoglycan/xylan/chitin deacetylase (PgdA/CDA1 family)
MPGCFGIARLLGPSYSLRCVVFHHIASEDSPFTAGINVRATPEQLEVALRFLIKYYKPVRLEDVLEDKDGRHLPQRAVLVTFDDAYASVWKVAAPLCKKYGIPAVYFVNAAFLNNRRLAPDNLICYVANVKGMETVNAAARTLGLAEFSDLRSLSEVFSNFFPSITLVEREAFLESLHRLSGVSESHLAEELALYLTTEQLRSLATYDFEIGNHTYSHVHCRRLSGDEFDHEIDRNKSELEELSGKKVRSFSLPYGSSRDLTAELASQLKRSGHEAVFLSESVANLRGADHFRLDRVNPNVQGEASFFLDLEILPRLRGVRNQLFRPQSALMTVAGTANQNEAANRS